MFAKLFTSACAALAALTLAASSLTTAPKRMEPPKPKPIADVKAVAKDNNAFALSMFQEQRLGANSS